MFPGKSAILCWKPVPVTALDRIRPHGRDGNAAGAPRPATRRAKLRSGPRLGAYTPSRSVENGRLPEARERSSVYTNRVLRLRFPASLNQTIHFPAKFLRRGGYGCSPGIDHNVPLRSDLGEPHPEQFPDPALGPVAEHRFSERARNGETQTRTLAVFEGEAKSGKVLTRNPDATVINYAEFRAPQDARRLRKFTWRNGQLARRSPSACDVPWPGAARAPRVLPCSPCVRGTRASSPVCGCSAEMYVLAFFSHGRTAGRGATLRQNMG